DVLRLVRVVESLAMRDEHRAVATEHDARSEMVSAGHLRLLPVDHAHRIESAVTEARARDRRSRGSVVARLCVREIDDLVLRECRIEGDVEQSALAFREYARHTGERR